MADETSSKGAQKGIRHSHQVCQREEFLEALYSNTIPLASYNQLNWNKFRSKMAITAVTKPALSVIYTKFRVRDKVICEPYDN